MNKPYILNEYKFLDYPIEIYSHPHDEFATKQSSFSIVDLDIECIVAIARNLRINDNSEYYCDIDATLTNICQIDYFYSRMPLEVVLNPHGIICSISPYNRIYQINEHFKRNMNDI